jgi:hypothetical protein
MTVSKTFSHLHNVQPSHGRLEADPILGMLAATGFAVAVAPLNGDYVSGMRIHIAHRDTGRALTWGAFCHVMDRAGFDPASVVADRISALAESVELRSWWRACTDTYCRTIARKFTAGESNTTQERDLDRLAQLVALCIYRPGSGRGQIGTLTRGETRGPLAFLAAAHLAQ